MLMKKIAFCAAALAVLCLAASPALAEIINCPVDVDTHYLDGHGGGNYGYPLSHTVKTFDPAVLTAIGLVRFDLSGLDGYAADDILSARFMFYVESQPGSPQGAPGYGAPDGVTIYSSVHALDNSVTLTEELLPGEPEGYYRAHGVITAANRPGNVGDSFIGQSTGTEAWGFVDITDIVKDWADGALFNNGIEFADEADAGEYSTYFTSIQGEEAGHHPYLEVNAVPEPVTMMLLGSGILTLVGLRRRRGIV